MTEPVEPTSSAPAHAAGGDDNAAKVGVAELLAAVAGQDEETAQEPETVEVVAEKDDPALLVARLGLSTKAGPVFADVDLIVQPGTAAAVVGDQGSGRSCFLLAVTGRMAVTSGAVAVAGNHDLRLIRQGTAIARIGGVVELEDTLTVAESVRERCLIDGEKHATGRRRFAEAARILGLTARPEEKIEELSAPDRTRLCVALACVRQSHLIVLDDLDRECSATQQTELLAALAELAAQGPAILVSTVDPEPAKSAGLQTVSLRRDPEPPAAVPTHHAAPTN